MGYEPKPPPVQPAPIFRIPSPTPTPLHPIPSSSPAFDTPIHPIRSFDVTAPALSKTTILPILLPSAILRPVAFRIFTKKHDLTLTSAALQALATFVGKHCGAGWREEGLAEKVLDDVAKTWKKNGGGVLVDGASEQLKATIRDLEGCMVAGRIVQDKYLARKESFTFGANADGDTDANGFHSKPYSLRQDENQSSIGMSELLVDEDEGNSKDVRNWLKVIGAFEQPRLSYDVSKKHFERINTAPSLLPPPSHKLDLFRHRYDLIYQRLLRNDAFQTPSFAPNHIPSLQRSSSTLATAQHSYKITPISNLLGRGGSSHLLLGLLALTPTGTLAISDLSGSIALDLQQAKPLPEDGAWFCPGMIVLVDGVYEEEYNIAAGGFGGGGGVGGTIGGKFVGFTIGGPPCERREITLGVSGTGQNGDVTAGGGFGWVDFLGVGSERALGPKMRKLEHRLLHAPLDSEFGAGAGRIIILGEVNLDHSRALVALKKVIGIYAAEPEEDAPIAFVLMGNFVQDAVVAGGGSGGSIEYKEYFDSLASALSEFPSILQQSSFIFVPGDNDPWASAFSAGAATPIPRKGVPDLFTSRVKRAFASANAEAESTQGRKVIGGAIWTTNPSRLSLFGPSQEIVFFRDDVSGRLRRNAIKFRVRDHDEEVDTREKVRMDPAKRGSDERMEVDPAVLEAESHVPSTAEDEQENVALSMDLHLARKLTKTMLDQGHLSPFPLSTRPILWDHASALQLYPLPTSLVLADTEAPPFCVTYEGCHVMNPGRLVEDGRGRKAKWVEYDVRLRRGRLRESTF